MLSQFNLHLLNTTTLFFISGKLSKRGFRILQRDSHRGMDLHDDRAPNDVGVTLVAQEGGQQVLAGGQQV